MEEQTPASTTPSTPSPPWTITRVELDGVAVRTTMTMRRMQQMLLFALVVFAAIETYAWTPWMPSRWGGVTIALKVFGVVALLGAVQVWRSTRKALRRFASVLPEVWESNGCVCPWCLVRVDKKPCDQHELTAADEVYLRAYWEAAARQNVHGAMLGLEHLRTLRVGPGFWSPFSALVRKPFRLSLDPDATFRDRLRASLSIIVLGFVGTAAVIALISVLAGGQYFLVLSSFFVLPLLVASSCLIGPQLRIGALRCAKCSHLCASEEPTRCSECGAHLTAPASTTRVERVRSPWSMLVPILGFLPLLLFIGHAQLSGGLLGWLPLSARTSIYSATGAPREFLGELNLTTITSSDAVIAADYLLELVATKEQSPHLPGLDFIPRAVAAGKLPTRYLELAARATAKATLVVEPNATGATITVVPRFGSRLFGMAQVVHMAVGGCSVDGQAWSPGAEWTVSPEQTDPEWRATAAKFGRVIPDSQTRFELEVELSPGAHDLRVRGWLILTALDFVPLIPTFDAGGELVRAPRMHAIFPFELSERVTVQAP